MQPISYNANQSYGYQNAGQSYPVYANCFDRLTTNGIIAEDVVGYITDVPSPYLQNYVAQRGGVPTMPGQIMPDPLPVAPNPAPMAVPGGSVYKDIPQNLNTHTFEKNDKYMGLKKTALALLLTGLTVLGLVKTRKLFKKGSANANISVKNPFPKIKNFLKNGWNKIFHKTP